jgi:hypothetical protein
MLFLLSDLKVLKIVATEEQEFYHADILVPNADYYVNDVSLVSLFNFSEAELRKIHDNHVTTYSAPIKWDRETLEGAVLNVMKSIEPDNTEIWQLRAKLGREIAAPQITPLTAAQRASQCGDANAQPIINNRTTSETSTPTTAKRPAEGSTSGSIWAKADEILNTSGFASVRDALVVWGNENALNLSTVRTQYSHWRKFYNLG